MSSPSAPALQLALAATLTALCSAQDASGPEAAQRLGKEREAVRVQPDGLFICEAEEFRSQSGPEAGDRWQARKFGENYYAATFANSFLSRQAFLAAPEQCDSLVASQQLEIDQAGRYLVLVRYEAAYRFETQFRVQVEQGGVVLLDRLYGARDNLKIWAFSQGLQKEVAWSWGAVENIVWEGHDVSVDLKPGPATVRLIAARQPEPAAKRHVDLVMLTTDVQQVQERIAKEKYLPLDGMLTQSGDVFLRVTNPGDQALRFTGRKVAGGGNWQQHSPYWVHLRDWEFPVIDVEPGGTSDWLEVGGTMDTLAAGQWFWTGNGRYRAEFGVRNAAGKIEPLADFTGEGELTLAAEADTRYSRRLRRQDQVLYDLLQFLGDVDLSGEPRRLHRTPVYATTFQPLDDKRHAAAVLRFRELFSLIDPKPAGEHGYTDVRGVPTARLGQRCRELADAADRMSVVSLGDEIGLPSPQGSDATEGFREFLRAQPAAESAAAADSAVYSIDEATKRSDPARYYWSKRYQHHFGIQAIKERTDILRRHFPQAGVGANFSPHYPQQHAYLGEVYKWVTVFRESGMTLPWSEDYIWQVPVGTPQMNHINLDLFRAGLRHHPQRDIMYYVMPHMPNNTPRQWRRLFFGALAHGMTQVNLFEFRPVHVAYTENHVDDPAMYGMILRSFHELAAFEDIVQDGTVRQGQAGLWFSETGDIWNDNRGSFAAAKRALYTAIRHQQIPLDVLVESDALDGTLADYRVLYLTDAHVSTAASRQIAAWVRSGGHLFATAGAGMFNELNQPNDTLRGLLGVDPGPLEEPDDAQVTWIKQDLPFVPVLDVASRDEESPVGEAGQDENSFPVIAVRQRFAAPPDARVLFRFSDQTPAVVRRDVGDGQVTYCGCLPGLSYFHAAIPKRPVDRGATDDAMIHFLPTQFSPEVSRLIASAANSIVSPVTCSEPLVESTVIESRQGFAVPLINWTPEPVRNLRVSVRLPERQSVTRASGRPVTVETVDGVRVLTLDLDVADALIFR